MIQINNLGSKDIRLNKEHDCVLINKRLQMYNVHTNKIKYTTLNEHID